METFSALLAISVGNSPVPGEFPAQRPVTQSFDVFFDLRLNKRLTKQSWGWWFETPPRPLWRHSNELIIRCGGLRVYSLQKCDAITNSSANGSAVFAWQLGPWWLKACDTLMSLLKNTLLVTKYFLKETKQQRYVSIFGKLNTRNIPSHLTRGIYCWCSANHDENKTSIMSTLYN